jgi:hypothetical protein
LRKDGLVDGLRMTALAAGLAGTFVGNDNEADFPGAGAIDVISLRLENIKPPLPTWKAFLNNHVNDIVACDFFTVPITTFRVLFVFIMLAHERRRIVHVNVSEHPTAQWTAQQMSRRFPGTPHLATC